MCAICGVVLTKGQCEVVVVEVGVEVEVEVKWGMKQDRGGIKAGRERA